MNETKVLSISPSKIQAADCPFYFFSQYQKGDVSIQDDALTPVNLLFGRMAHLVVEKYVKFLIEHKLPSDLDVFNQIFRACWDLNSYIPESRHDELQEMLLLFAEAFAIEPGKVWGAEIAIALDRDLNKVEWDNPAKWLRVKLDRVDIHEEHSTAVITDYKTAFYIPPVSELSKGLQGTIYPFALHQLNKLIQHFQVVFHYIRWNKKQTVNFHVQGAVPLTEDSVLFEPDKIEAKLRNFTERMEKKIANPNAEWPAITGDLCPICRYECPLIAKGITPLKELPQAVECAMQIEALGDKLKKLKENLKAYTKATESEISTNSGTWGWNASETIRGLKPDKLAAYALERGIDLNLLLSVDQDKIKELAEDEIKREIVAMGKTSVSTRFGFKKAEE